MKVGKNVFNKIIGLKIVLSYNKLYILYIYVFCYQFSGNSYGAFDYPAKLKRLTGWWSASLNAIVNSILTFSPTLIRATSSVLPSLCWTRHCTILALEKNPLPITLCRWIGGLIMVEICHTSCYRYTYISLLSS